MRTPVPNEHSCPVHLLLPFRLYAFRFAEAWGSPSQQEPIAQLNISPFGQPEDGNPWHRAELLPCLQACQDVVPEETWSARYDDEAVIPYLIRATVIVLERQQQADDRTAYERLARPPVLEQLDALCQASAALIHAFLYVPRDKGIRIPEGGKRDFGIDNLRLARLHLARGRPAGDDGNLEAGAYACAAKFKSLDVPHHDDGHRLAWRRTVLSRRTGEWIWRNAAAPDKPTTFVVRATRSMRQAYAEQERQRSLLQKRAEVVRFTQKTGALPALKLFGRTENPFTCTSTIEIYLDRTDHAGHMLGVVHRRKNGDAEQVEYTIYWTSFALYMGIDAHVAGHGTLRCRFLRALDQRQLVFRADKRKRDD